TLALSEGRDGLGVVVERRRRRAGPPDRRGQVRVERDELLVFRTKPRAQLRWPFGYLRLDLRDHAAHLRNIAKPLFGVLSQRARDRGGERRWNLGIEDVERGRIHGLDLLQQLDRVVGGERPAPAEE